jgi:eukaryotic-like serine/threonine-protein kinase
LPAITLPPEFVGVLELRPGQNAKVFRATQRLLGRDVFLKVYEVPANDPDSALREPQLLQQLQHPNLVRIHSAQELDDAQVLLEMELIAGGSLQDFIEQASENQAWPPIHDCVAMVAEVADGLGHMHSRGYVHRDVKPANIMQRRATKPVAILADLGLAAKLGDNGRAHGSKHSRLYRPPEAWKGSGYSKASDVYQLGLVLFQLLGGKIRYDLANLSDDELARAVLRGDIADWSGVLPHVSPRTVDVARKALEHELARYASVSQLIAALEHAKRKQVNWSYKGRPDGFDLERTDRRHRTVRVAGDIDGKRITLTRRRAVPTGGMRRCGADLHLPARTQLRTNRKFQTLLRDS